MSMIPQAFIDYGTELQYSATTPQRARDAFTNSCKICCTRGYQLPCNKCGIAAVHNSIMLIKFNERSVS